MYNAVRCVISNSRLCDIIFHAISHHDHHGSALSPGYYQIAPRSQGGGYNTLILITLKRRGIIFKEIYAQRFADTPQQIGVNKGT